MSRIYKIGIQGDLGSNHHLMLTHLFKGKLDAVDVPVVFFSPEAVENKKLDPISKEQIFNAFGRDDLIVFTQPSEFKLFLKEQDYNNTALLLMSSGNYGGLDFEEIKEWI